MDRLLEKTLQVVARFYDERKVGDVGPLGFRRSTDLSTLLGGVPRLLAERIIVPGKTRFLDLGCADGRVNVLLSYLVRNSVGVELDEWTLEEYTPLKMELEGILKEKDLLLPPDNISLFQGDSMDGALHRKIEREARVTFFDFDLFYTYLVMHDEFAELIARKGKEGATFMVYGLKDVFPRYEGLHLLERMSPLGGILGIYRNG